MAQIIQSEEITTPTVGSCSSADSVNGKRADKEPGVPGFGKALGLFSDADFSQPVNHCDKCNDPTQKDMEILGIMRRVPVLCRCRTHANEREQKAAELRELMRRLDKFKAYSLMDSRFEASTFENWEHRPDNRNDYILGTKYCEKWADMYANNRGLLLYGRAGNGKTFLSFAIANAL